MLYLQGEPFLNRNIFEMIRLASKKKIYTCLSTNGHFLDKPTATQTVLSGLNRIMISVDGTTNDVYRQYRQGGNLETVLEGIKNLVEAKHALKSKTPYIIMQFIVFKHNQHQINEFRTLGKSIGADKTELKTAQLFDFKNGHPMLTDLQKYARYEKSGKRYVFKKSLQNNCKRIWTTGVITTDGIVVPCCYDKDAKYAMGNADKEGMKLLWKRTTFMQFRKKILENRIEVDICCNCDE
jgi:radical SAM protein with 4Fe4S-binding SPASM domain